MAGRLDGKVAVITGAARGQGRSHAVRFAEEGADVVALDLCASPGASYADPATPEDLEETATQVRARGRRVVTAKVDVRSEAELRAAIEEAVAVLGRLDIAVSNAGIGVYPALAHELDAQLWRDQIDVNLTGAWHFTKAVTPHLLAAGGGAIVVVSSAAIYTGIQHGVGYVAAKTGLTGLVRTLANELGPHSIRVNSVHPAMVDTPMVQNEGMYRLFCPHLSHPSKEDFAAVARSGVVLPIPWIEVEDVTNAVLFLVSDEGRYVTGVHLPVDAGAAIR